MRYVRNLRCAVFSTATFAASYTFCLYGSFLAGVVCGRTSCFLSERSCSGDVDGGLAERQARCQGIRIAKDTDNKDISTPSGDQAKLDHLFIED